MDTVMVYGNKYAWSIKMSKPKEFVVEADDIVGESLRWYKIGIDRALFFNSKKLIIPAEFKDTYDLGYAYGDELQKRILGKIGIEI